MYVDLSLHLNFSMGTNYWIIMKNYAMEFKCGIIVKCAAASRKCQTIRSN